MGMPRYTIDAGFFELESAVSLYWLGFTFCDGCVFHRTRLGRTEWLYQVKLRRSDEAHLFTLRSCLAYSGPVKRPSVDSSSIVVYSKELCASLLRRGMRCNKTYRGVAIPSVPDCFILPFAQGIFDANGSISKDKYGLKLGVSGPPALPDWFRVQVATHVGLETGYGCLQSKGPANEVTWHGNKKVRLIAKWLLQDSGSFRLPRQIDRLTSHIGGAS